VHAIDIAKFLIDKGYHPPTVYFPLIVKEAIMIEPTETESDPTAFAACPPPCRSPGWMRPRRHGSRTSAAWVSTVCGYTPERADRGFPVGSFRLQLYKVLRCYLPDIHTRGKSGHGDAAARRHLNIHKIDCFYHRAFCYIKHL